MDIDKHEKLKESAINEALNSNWKEAINLNKAILEHDKDDTATLLRLGYAYLQVNDLKNSKKAYSSALKLNPSNQIARSNLEKIKILEKKGSIKKTKGENGKKSLSDPGLFINIRGKTQVFTLVHIGQADVLASLSVGQCVSLSIKKRRVEMRTQDGEYVGALPDDVSKRLMLLIRGGSSYEAYIKEASKNNVDVFIKEIKLGKKVKRFVSFPKNIQDDIRTMEEEEEEEEKKEVGGAEEVDSESDEPDDTDEDDESIVDLDKLAEQAEESDYFESSSAASEDDEEEL